MSRKAVSGVLLTLLLIGVLVLGFNIQPVMAEPRTWTVDDDGPADFPTIQEAINNASEGDTIFVSSGMYFENVVVNKTLNIIGENPNETIVDGGGAGTVLHITVEKVNITRLTVQNGLHGIWVDYATKCTIEENTFANNTFALYGIQVLFCTVHRNFFVSNEYGMWVSGFLGLEVSKNLVCYNVYGASLRDGYDTAIFENHVKNNTVCGLHLQKFRRSIVYGNIVEENGCGLRLQYVWNNDFFHNNIIRNDNQTMFVVYAPGDNRWDKNYEGNYWSNYTGVDLFSGPYQTETGSDGIGDTPYLIDEDNVDNYPLMGTFSDFNATWQEETYHVNVISNSTVSNFEIGEIAIPPTGLVREIRFNVAGKDETLGFCRIRIPRTLIDGTYKVFVNGTEVPYTLLSCSNSTHNHLYFTYNHSTQEVAIIPEFPSFLILPLLMIMTLLAVTVYRRKPKSY